MCLERFLWHGYIQVQTLELIISWNRIIDTSCDEHLAFSLWASRSIFCCVERRFKRILCLAVCPSLVE